MTRVARAGLVAAACAVSVAAASARLAQEPGYPFTPYDGQLTFVRLYFEEQGGGGGRFRGGEPPWHHDYPYAERNLMSIVHEITFAHGAAGSNVMRPTDPELFRFPIAWMAEPGRWSPTEAEIESLRAYLLKGGFIIFDDFGGYSRGGGDELSYVIQLMNRILPGLRPFELDGSAAIFHSFFDIEPDSLLLRSYRAEREGERYIGYFEDNDPGGRQLAILNANNDIGEFMEYRETGFSAVNMANEAYKLGVNYLIYAMTH